MYYICWHDKLTGCTGRGTMPLAYADAVALVERMNGEHPFVKHWIEKVN